MSTAVDRNPEEQLAFGKYLNDFSDNIREACKRVKGHIDDAGDNIKHDEAVKAMEQLVEIMDQIISILPGIEEFGADQIKRANLIIEARDKPIRLK